MSTKRTDSVATPGIVLVDLEAGPSHLLTGVICDEAGYTQDDIENGTSPWYCDLPIDHTGWHESAGCTGRVYAIWPPKEERSDE